jgi:hypothetical protein
MLERGERDLGSIGRVGWVMAVCWRPRTRRSVGVGWSIDLREKSRYKREFVGEFLGLVLVAAPLRSGLWPRSTSG